MMQRLKPSLVISYNYNHIIKPDVIELFPRKIINLHTSLLPYNRGASPNFWSFIDDTPKGVTVHQLDEGLDTGAIIFQKRMYFDEDTETLASSYQKLQDAIQDLVKNNWETIASGNYSVVPQKGEGSFHRAVDMKNLIGGNPPYHVKISELKAWVYCRRL